MISILTQEEWTSIGTSPKDDKFWGKARINHINKYNFEYSFESHETGDRYKNGDWSGILTISDNYTFSGKIYWELKSQTNYGIKEIFLQEDEDFYYLFIFPINTFGQEFGKEVLRRAR